MKLKRTCKQCGKEFNFRGCPTDISSGRGKYCSYKCSHESHRKLPKFFVCQYCKKKFTNTEGRLRKFCSRQCVDGSKVGRPSWNKGKENPKIQGEKNHHWNGGIRIHEGYFRVYLSPRNYKKRSRLVMEQHLGRELSKIEVVHHIDGDKLNDDINNLMLFPNNQEHLTNHRRIKCLTH